MLQDACTYLTTSRVTHGYERVNMSISLDAHPCSLTSFHTGLLGDYSCLATVTGSKVYVANKIAAYFNNWNYVWTLKSWNKMSGAVCCSSECVKVFYVCFVKMVLCKSCWSIEIKCCIVASVTFSNLEFSTCWCTAGNRSSNGRDGRSAWGWALPVTEQGRDPRRNGKPKSRVIPISWRGYTL